MQNASPSTVGLRFGGPGIAPEQVERLRAGLSALKRIGPHLWTACDESPVIDRLTLQPDGTFGGHRTFALADYVDLPGAGEVDVEGLAWEEPYLWVVGSHSRRRRRPHADDSPEKAMERLADVDRDRSRALLARIPLVPAEDGGWEPRRRAPAPDGAGAEATAARLKGRGLRRLLRDDPHLAAALRWPGKDNGLDVEGLAACEGRLFVGLRGPVLRGWAVVLELRLESAHRADRVRARRIGPRGERYRKHFLHLHGLGVRDLYADGDDLLVLAGPTADVAGPAAVYRWHGGARAAAPGLVSAPEVECVLDLPFQPRQAGDRPEGLTRLPEGPRSVLVAYDGALPERVGGGLVRADLLELRG